MKNSTISFGLILLTLFFSTILIVNDTIKSKEEKKTKRVSTYKKNYSNVYGEQLPIIVIKKD
ncbi:hypothetical protein ACFS5J_09070 [Flavobacterium chuncheonense]|uniref:Uncharacterized protein n=1 Tax=Flavobacterium chuncheonense TaxID=2026653 RepID=A0ABW5YMB5_9FLAO